MAKDCRRFAEARAHQCSAYRHRCLPRRDPVLAGDADMDELFGKNGNAWRVRALAPHERCGSPMRTQTAINSGSKIHFLSSLRMIGGLRRFAVRPTGGFPPPRSTALGGNAAFCARGITAWYAPAAAAPAEASRIGAPNFGFQASPRASARSGGNRRKRTAAGSVGPYGPEHRYRAYAGYPAADRPSRPPLKRPAAVLIAAVRVPDHGIVAGNMRETAEVDRVGELRFASRELFIAACADDELRAD